MAKQGKSRGQRRVRGYHHGDLRAALIDATLALVKERAPTELTLREAARRAKVSPAAPYHHFADKNALLAAVAVEGFAQLTAQLTPLLAERGPDRAQLVERALDVYVRFARDHAGHFRVMFLPELHTGEQVELEEAAKACLALVVQLVSGGAPTAETMELSVVAFALAHGIATLAPKEGLWDELGADGLTKAVRRAAQVLSRALPERP